MTSTPADKTDIWSADAYGTKVAPFVATLTDKIVQWLDPQPQGIDPQTLLRLVDRRDQLTWPSR